MDATGLYDDEVIADSEEEDNILELQCNGSMHADANLTMRLNTYQPIDPTPASLAPNAQSSESTKITLQSEPATRPRPRPRPAYKKAATNVVDPASSSTNPSANPIFPRQPAFTSDTYIGLPSSTSNIADRAKTRSRKIKPKVVDIIELTSDEDEMGLLPAQKSRPKPKPKYNAKPRTSQWSNGFPTPTLQADGDKQSTNKHIKMSHSNSQHIPASQDTLPVPTSSNHPNDFTIPAKLPPSDPPTSTAATYDHPPIVTLPVHDTDVDISPSSPSSLFSVPSSSLKRKRNCINELDSDSDEVPNSRMVDPPTIPALPPFLAGSSSPCNTPPHIPPVEIVDLTMIKATADPKLPLKKAPKPRKPRKKSGETIKDGEGLETGKPRTKKTRVQKKKLEVVIDERSKNNTKAKQREVFKSREFIDDDDDVADHITVKITNSSKPESLTSLSSVPDFEDDKQEGSSKQREFVASEDAELVTKGKGKESVAAQNESDVRAKVIKKGKGKRVIVSDDENEDEITAISSRKKSRVGAADKGRGKTNSDALEADASGAHTEGLPRNQNKSDEEEPSILKENVQPIPSPTPPTAPMPSLFPSLASRYTIAPRTKSTPMSELIRRVNSLPGSPFSTPRPRASGSSHVKASGPGTVYSPYLKSSKSLLSRIAPLHPHRRTPPPPLPPPPPPKKTRKEREREEQWEEELIESVGGITEWACMTDAERKELRKAKWEREMFGWED